MPRSRGQRLNFSFVKGLNTEASPLTFPENTALDLDNVVLDVDGSIRRRGGVDYDNKTDYFAEAPDSDYLTHAIRMGVWDNVGGDANNKFVVSQYGNTLYFHSFGGLETLENYIGGIDFSAYAINLAEARKDALNFTSGLGYLFVTGKYIDPFYVSYKSGTLSASDILIEIRDFDGVDDNLDVDERPTDLSDYHHYNLRNQGWPKSFDCSYKEGSKSTTDPVAYTFDKSGFYPSNADIVYLGKTSIGSNADSLDRYDPTVLKKAIVGSTPAPKGHYILNAFNRDRSTLSGYNVPNGDKTFSTRPTSVAFHNGRVFYGGSTDVGYVGKVYYSQQLTNIKNAGKCYQKNDPTSEDANQILATDGGVISITDAGAIQYMEESSIGLLVFASNGVWEITGENESFTATSVDVRKVTELGVTSGESVVNADGTWLYWSNTGIVSLTRDKVSGSLTAEVVSKNTIKTFFNQIPEAIKTHVRGKYIRNEKKVYWLYSNSDSFDGLNTAFKANRVLILDVQIGAFYPYTISDVNADAPPYVSDISEMGSAVVTTVAEGVTAGGTQVTSGGVDVTVSGSGFGSEDSVFSALKLLCVRPTSVGNYGLTFGEFRGNTFHDWYYYDGVGADYVSFLETGYDHGGAPVYTKQPTYIYTYLRTTSKSDFPVLPTFS